MNQEQKNTKATNNPFIIKICGMRNAQNIRAVEALGIDWMGFIFYSKSPRYVDVCPDYMPSAQKCIGVFVNESIEQVVAKVEQFGLQGVQLHGQENAAYCQMLRDVCPQLYIIKAFSIASAHDLKTCTDYESVCDYFLFDTKCTMVGGSGRTFDWSVLEEYKGSIPFLLSGGISADNLEALLHFRHQRWCGIDLNSRFETAPALKDVEALRTFLDAWHRGFEK